MISSMTITMTSVGQVGSCSSLVGGVIGHHGTIGVPNQGNSAPRSRLHAGYSGYNKKGDLKNLKFFKEKQMCL